MATNNTVLLTNEPQSVIWIEAGRVRMQGSAEEIREAGFVMESKEEVGDELELESQTHSTRSRKVSSAAVDESSAKEKAKLIKEENRARGQVNLGHYLSYFKAGGGVVYMAAIIIS